MSKYVSDTMALVLYLEKRKMPAKAKQIFSAAEQGEHEIYIPIMVMAEIGYLSEKGRIQTTLGEVEQKMARDKNFKEEPMDLAFVKASFQIDDIPELHDRLIAGTAKALGLEIISNDPFMTQSVHVATVWK
ncbi:MAG: type II toxin-antitoxin system VapC family toxin [Saprospiraceae bacterium]